LISSTLLADFLIFFAHMVQHKVWWLWEFHKAHHAAEFMPLGLTARRNHLVDDWLKYGVPTLFGSVVFVLFAYVIGRNVADTFIWGLDLFLIFKLLSFYHLKHSHVNLRFPYVIERYFLISPAQHQLHHSTEERHYDRNFGTLFSAWDVLFGTWHRSEEKPIKIGLPESAEFHGPGKLWYTPIAVAKLYYLPFVNIFRELRTRHGGQPTTPTTNTNQPKVA
jgi:sterol desaturase/sphingolipid hydroxylase (fatty acid hydroxylase superfamily)